MIPKDFRQNTGCGCGENRLKHSSACPKISRRASAQRQQKLRVALISGDETLK